MKKVSIPSELFYLIGIVIMAAGTAFMNRADLGVSMVVAPAKVLSMKTGISFGWSDVIMQVFLLALLGIVIRRFRVGFLLSFVTAFLYGRVLDLFILLMQGLPTEMLWMRMIWAAVGMVVTSVGVAAFFQTYLPPESYDLFVREVSERYHLSLGKLKTGYDFTSLGVAAVMTFALFGTEVIDWWRQGDFGAIGPATVLCAVINGAMIAAFSEWMKTHLNPYHALPLAKYFTDSSSGETREDNL